MRHVKKHLMGEQELVEAEGTGKNKKRSALGMVQGLSRVEQGMLDRVASCDKEMRCVQLDSGMLYNYKSGEFLNVLARRHSNSAQEVSGTMQLFSECRGLVLRDGAVVSRPVQRFHRVSEMGGLAATVTAEVVTAKLDGQMMCGVVLGEEAQLWSRAGPTGAAQAAMAVARQTEGLLQLISAVWELGGSPTFEFIGRQNTVKVRYGGAELVLVAVRDRVSGRWWGYELLEQMCDRYKVKLVHRHSELEGKTLREIRTQVEGWHGKEGVVVWLRDDCICKVKSSWWLGRELKQKLRWVNKEGITGQDEARQKRQRYTETRAQRVVLRGWDSKVCPVLALGLFKEASKVEALYRRSDGRQGTLVLGFADEGEARKARGRHTFGAVVVWAEQAYSGRSRGDEYRMVRTWWRHSDTKSSAFGATEKATEVAPSAWSGCDVQDEGGAESRVGNGIESRCGSGTRNKNGIGNGNSTRNARVSRRGGEWMRNESRKRRIESENRARNESECEAGTVAPSARSGWDVQGEVAAGGGVWDESRSGGEEEDESVREDESVCENETGGEDESECVDEIEEYDGWMENMEVLQEERRARRKLKARNKLERKRQEWSEKRSV